MIKFFLVAGRLLPLLWQVPKAAWSLLVLLITTFGKGK
jgi:hypothetical protein